MTTSGVAMAILVLAAAGAPGLCQSNCSSIAGQCTKNEGSSTQCASTSVVQTTVSFTWDCAALCHNSWLHVNYGANPSSGQKTATGQCGKTQNGVKVDTRVECPPQALTPVNTPAPTHPGTNQWSAGFLNRTQRTPNFDGCNDGAVTTFVSSCPTSACSGGGEACPENTSCEFDPSSYTSQDPCLYPDSPHCPVGWILDCC